MVKFAQVGWVQHVVEDHLGLMVGNMLQLVRARDIAQRPHTFGRGATVLVNLDATIVVHLHTTGCKIHTVTVGDASGCH